MDLISQEILSSCNEKIACSQVLSFCSSAVINPKNASLCHPKLLILDCPPVVWFFCSVPRETNDLSLFLCDLQLRCCSFLLSRDETFLSLIFLFQVILILCIFFPFCRSKLSSCFSLVTCLFRQALLDPPQTLSLLVSLVSVSAHQTKVLFSKSALPEEEINFLRIVLQILLT